MKRYLIPHMGSSTLAELAEQRAVQYSSKRVYTFLTDGETTEIHLTYQELDRRAKALAAHLQVAGLAGERVLLLYPSGLDFIVAFFGCLYAQAIAVPVALPHSGHHSMRRLQAIVTDAQPLALLTTKRVYTTIERQITSAPEIRNMHWITTDSEDIGDNAGYAPVKIGGETLAYLQYTSGSTATPKGVMLTHNAVLQHLSTLQECLALTEDDAAVSWSPLYHDMGLVGNVLLPLYVGGSQTFMTPAAFLQRPIRWLRAIARTGATVSGGPNFAYEFCAHQISAQQRADLDLQRWRCAYTGAEPVRSETLELFARTFEACGFQQRAFYPCYGLAEATLFVSGRKEQDVPVIRAFDRTALERGEAIATNKLGAHTRTLVSCGQVVRDSEVVIVDPTHKTRCSSGQVGEIWLTGPAVAQGYWNRPQESEQTFRAQLVDEPEAGSFLRTGDLGFLSADELFIVARLKDMLIIRGRNHYPQDIEATVEQCHPALQPTCCAAFAIEVEHEDRLIVVQEVTRQHRNANGQEIIAAILQAISSEHGLQPFALALVRPGGIPKTSSGKVQRFACKELWLQEELAVLWRWENEKPPLSTQKTTEESSAEPVSSLTQENIQALLRTVFQKHLAEKFGMRAPEIDVRMPFAYYGLDSLAAVRIVHELEEHLGRSFSPVLLYEHPTIEAVARYIMGEDPEGSTAEQPLPALEPSTEAEEHYPLSYAQERMWFFEQTVPGSTGPRDNLPIGIRLVGPLLPEVLLQSIEELVRRHDVLRTNFVIQQGRPLQAIRPYQVRTQTQEIGISNNFALSCVDLTQWTRSQQEAEVTRLLHEEQYLTFDLITDALLRVKLIRLAEQEWVLLLNMHHIISDAWSLGILLGELGMLYAAFSAGNPSPLPHLRIQYADYARWQHRWLTGTFLERQLAYWSKQLADAPTLLALPTDHVRPSVRSYAGRCFSFAVAKEVSAGIIALGRSEGGTLFITLLTAFTLLMYRASGQEDIVIGSILAGRLRAETEALIGLFTQIMALRTQIKDGAITFRTLLQRVQATTLDAYTYQDVPFQLVIEHLGITQNPSYTTLFQVMFILQNAPLSTGALQLGEVSMQPLGDEWVQWEAELAPCDLELHMFASEDELLRGNLYYSTELFEAATIERLMACFQDILAQIASDPDRRVNEFLCEKMLPIA